MLKNKKTENKAKPQLGDHEQIRLYIVSPNTLQAQLLQSCLDLEFGHPCFCHNDLYLRDLIAKSTDCHGLYLMDCLQADMEAIENKLHIGSSTVPKNIFVALYNMDKGCRLAPLVNRYKIRGVFFHDDSQDKFIKGIRSILNEDLWLSRKLLSECVLMPEKVVNVPSAKTLLQLSRREIEILRHVGYGRSNQEIANTFNISLHTVKTHIYNIYKKINTSNRLQATLWAANYLSDHEDASPNKYETRRIDN